MIDSGHCSRGQCSNIIRETALVYGKELGDIYNRIMWQATSACSEWHIAGSLSQFRVPSEGSNNHCVYPTAIEFVGLDNENRTTISGTRANRVR